MEVVQVYRGMPDDQVVVAELFNGRAGSAAYGIKKVVSKTVVAKARFDVGSILKSIVGIIDQKDADVLSIDGGAYK